MKLMMTCGEKLAAAEQHLYRLDESGHRYFQENPHIVRVGGRVNSHGTKYLFGVQAMLRPLAMEWGVIVGDAIHCIRTSLDQLVFGLATEPDQNTQFPVARTRKDWVTRSPAQLWSLPDGVVEIIDRAQPYHDGDANGMHPLAILSTLSNMDKHQTIPVAALVSTRTSAQVIKTVGIESYKSLKFNLGRPLQVDAIVAESEIVRDGSGVQPEMHVNFSGQFEIGFGNISKAPSIIGTPVVPFVRDVLAVWAATQVVGPVTNHLRESGLLVPYPQGDQFPTPYPRKSS